MGENLPRPLRASQKNVKAAGFNRRLCAASVLLEAYYLALRLSFMRSPGDISDAPRDCPIVPFSCMRLPGLFSEAPGAVVVVESCISCPGLYCEAPGDAVPLLVVVCATANEAVPRSNAVAMAIVFDILISLGWSPGGNRGTLASFRLSELSISPPSAGQSRGLTAALTEGDACALFPSRQPRATGRLSRVPLFRRTPSSPSAGADGSKTTGSDSAVLHQTPGDSPWPH